VKGSDAVGEDIRNEEEQESEEKKEEKRIKRNPGARG